MYIYFLKDIEKKLSNVWNISYGAPQGSILGSLVPDIWKQYNASSVIDFIFISWRFITYITYLLTQRWFFFYRVFFHDHSQITGVQGKGEGISLTPHYHFHSLHRHLDINQAITAGSSSLHIGSSRTQTRNLFLPRANR